MTAGRNLGFERRRPWGVVSSRKLPQPKDVSHITNLAVGKDAAIEARKKDVRERRADCGKDVLLRRFAIAYPREAKPMRANGHAVVGRIRDDLTRRRAAAHAAEDFNVVVRVHRGAI